MLFITKYQNGFSSFGGMVRVKDIEKLVLSCVFLSINFSSALHRNVYVNNQGNKVHELGFLRILSIFQLIFNHKAIYFHTVGNFIKAFPYFLWIPRTHKYIDLHGAQPEEFQYSKSQTKKIVFNLFESLAFRMCDEFIHVSRRMIEHFENKYPFNNGNHYYVPIFPSNIDVHEKLELQTQANEARKALKIFDDKPIFLYSGGIQAWQKSDLVIDFLTSALDAGSRVIILSMQKEFFETAFSGYQNNSNLLVASVSPAKLSTYYLAANYGIMFRDNHILNEVASPTKFSEYLFYGMIPLLTSINVGDFVSLGIDYASPNDFCFSSSNHNKSEKNRQIILQAMQNSQKYKLKELLNEQ